MWHKNSRTQWGQNLFLSWLWHSKIRIVILQGVLHWYDAAKKMILLPLRTIYFRTFQCETPCGLYLSSICTLCFPYPNNFYTQAYQRVQVQTQFSLHKGFSLFGEHLGWRRRKKRLPLGISTRKRRTKSSFPFHTY